MRSLLLPSVFTLIAAVLVSARASADADTCRAEIAKGIDWASAATQAELDKADCETRSVYCVGVGGQPVPGESDPEVRSGESLTVKLLGPATCKDVLAATTHVRVSDVSLFRDLPAASQAKTVAVPVDAVLLSKTVVDTDLTTESITINVSRTDVNLNIEGVTLVVTPPRYYLDVGLLVAFTPFYRQVSTARVPGSKEQFIRETNDIRPAGAVALNFFPWGQYKAPRFSGYHGLAVQAAVGGDFSRIDDEFYLGLLWEPIPGAGLSAGLALLRMEKLQTDYSAGVIVQPDDVPRDTYLGARPYFGVSLNTEIFQTVLGLGGKARVPK